MLTLAAFHGTKTGLPGLYSRGVRLIGRGPYSHVELVFADVAAIQSGEPCLSGSASYMDGGVRLKRIAYTSGNWHFFPLPWADPEAALTWFEAHDGAGYDLVGNLRFLLPVIQDGSGRWFCSEAGAAALGLEEPWRYEPNHLVTVCRHLTEKAAISSYAFVQQA